MPGADALAAYASRLSADRRGGGPVEAAATEITEVTERKSLRARTGAASLKRQPREVAKGRKGQKGHAVEAEGLMAALGHGGTSPQAGADIGKRMPGEHE